MRESARERARERARASERARESNYTGLRAREREGTEHMCQDNQQTNMKCASALARFSSKNGTRNKNNTSGTTLRCAIARKGGRTHTAVCVWRVWGVGGVIHTCIHVRYIHAYTPSEQCVYVCVHTCIHTLLTYDAYMQTHAPHRSWYVHTHPPHIRWHFVLPLTQASLLAHMYAHIHTRLWPCLCLCEQELNVYYLDAPGQFTETEEAIWFPGVISVTASTFNIKRCNQYRKRSYYFQLVSYSYRLH
jgi:hypothetical protein